MKVKHVKNSALINSSKNEATNTREFLTHDNGGRPFKVSFSSSPEEEGVATIEIMKNHRILNREYLSYFIGESPENEMTRFSGGYGDNFKGNSILLLTSSPSSSLFSEKRSEGEIFEYVFIGEMIYSFTTPDKIISFVSPVGNNDVPYPYAIDEGNNVTLLIEKVKFQQSELTSRFDNFYTYYYSAIIMSTPQKGWGYKPLFPSNIKKYYIDEKFRFEEKDREEYVLTWEPPGKERKLNSNLHFILFKDGTLTTVRTRQMNKLMDEFNENLRVSAIPYKVIQKRNF